MTQQELFHRRLINSYVDHVSTTAFEEFMVRSELIRRTREYVGGMGPEAEQYARASTHIFFGGDKKAYADNLGEMATTNSREIYDIEVLPYGSTTITAIEL